MAASIWISVWQSYRKRFPLEKNIIFLNIGHPLLAITVSKEIWMKEYPLHWTENALPLAVIKDSLKIHFHEMGKLLPLERKFEEFVQNGFHYPQNQLQVARIQDLL